MRPPRDYDDIPGTYVQDSVHLRKGYHLNMFCLSLNEAGNRDAFRADEAACVERYPMTRPRAPFACAGWPCAARASAVPAGKARTLMAGDPRAGAAPLGSIIHTSAAECIVGLIRDAVDKGTVLLAGGSSDGTIIEATVLDRISPFMRVYSEERFGPIAGIVRVGSVEEAVRVANDIEYGLSAAVSRSAHNPPAAGWDRCTPVVIRPGSGSRLGSGGRIIRETGGCRSAGFGPRSHRFPR